MLFSAGSTLSAPMTSSPTPPRGSAHRVRSPSTLPQANLALGVACWYRYFFIVILLLFPFSSFYPLVSSNPLHFHQCCPLPTLTRQKSLGDKFVFFRRSTDEEHISSCLFLLFHSWQQSDVSTAIISRPRFLATRAMEPGDSGSRPRYVLHFRLSLVQLFSASCTVTYIRFLRPCHY